MHWERKLWHVTMVGTMSLCYAYAPIAWSWTFLIIGWLLFVPADILRLRRSSLNEAVTYAFRPLMRDSEVNHLAGTSYLLTGVVLLLLLFPRDICILTLLFLTFADPIASLVGIRYGKDKIFGHKSIQGFLAAFAVCTFISYWFFSSHALMLDRIFMVSLLSGFIGALAELVPIAKLDDNFTLPMLSAVGLSILFLIYGTVS